MYLNRQTHLVFTEWGLIRIQDLVEKEKAALILEFQNLTTDDECTRHATLAVCYQFVPSVWFCGRVSAWGAIPMVAVLAGSRKALVDTG